MFMQTPLRILLQEKGHTVHSVSPQTNVYESARKMNSLHIGALLVIDNGRLIGIISERDIVQKLIGCKCDPSETQVGEIMTSDLITVPPTMTVAEAMRIITEKRFRHLPVIENGDLKGMISIGDLTRWAIISQEQEIISLMGYISGEQK